MPPKNMKIENAVFYTADGRKIGKIEDCEVFAEAQDDQKPEFLNKAFRLEPIEGTFSASVTEKGKKIIAQLERETAIYWAGNSTNSISSHLAQFAKNRRIRKKHADICVEMLREFQKGGKEGRGC